jgi:hypothetical protein
MSAVRTETEPGLSLVRDLPAFQTLLADLAGSPSK